MSVSCKPVPATTRPVMIALLLLAQSGHCAEVITTAQPAPTAAVMKSASLDSEAGRAEPLVVDKKIPLAPGNVADARWQGVPATWITVARVQFDTPGAGKAAQPGSANPSRDTVRTGQLSWQISPDGTQVLDVKSGARSTVLPLTSLTVRPRDVAYNEQSGTVLFYGDDIYRYRTAARTLERLQLDHGSLQGVRKVASIPHGYWLATENGIFFLDEKAHLLRVAHAGIDGTKFINVAATGNSAWFATAEARLMRIVRDAPDRIRVSVSARLPGAPAEMYVANQSIWMLLGDKHGDHYNIASVDTALSQAEVIKGRYFSLSNADGQLTASTYSTISRIDPLNRTITRIRMAEAGLLARAARNESVLFLGSSYAYKDNCEIVEHGQIDISKGWINALSDQAYK